MWIMDLDQAQKNAAGEVALCYYQTVNPFVEVNGHQYKFVTKANICLAWIPLSDAPAILSKKGGCCGNKKANIFRVASEADVRRWSGVSDR